MSLFDKFKKHKITNDNWEFYQAYDEDGNISFTTIDLSYNDPPKQVGFLGELFVRVRIPEQKIHEGIPIPEEHSFQNEKEEELCEALVKSRIDCIQVGRITYFGQKQYIFEYNNLDGFKSIFNSWKNSFSTDYEIELNLLSPFEYYVDLLPDKFIWQQIGNRHVIERLLEAGSNEQKEHFIEHGIFGKQDDLKSLFNELKNHDISLISIEEDLMEVGIKSTLDLDEITNQTNYLMSVAEEHNCKYDGWNTKIEK